MRKSRPGFALPFALVLTAITAIIVGAVLSYTSHSARMTALYTGKTRCRLAAESAIEMMRYEIYHRFQLHVSENSTTGARVLIAPRNPAAFNWFSDSTTRRSIGTGKYAFTLPDHLDINGCRVRPRISRIQKRGESTGVIATLMATAEYRHGGVWVSATMAERVQFGIDRSTVFDNAYFVNNYGWFSGTGLVANGDVRANGNMSLDTSTTINGRVYAAANSELGVLGTIKNYGAMDKASTYRTTVYGIANRSRPMAPVNGGYEAPATVTTAECQKRLHAKEELGVSMPWISGLDGYVEYGKECGASLKQGSIVYISPDKGYYDGPGPSGERTVSDGKGNQVQAADYGVLVLTGTSTNPIKINGPVVVSNDVIISGYITGQGTIYSARNIHIVGSIIYKNPPVWADRTKAADNSTKDLVGLAAQGNIVLGDSTSSSWLSNIRSTISTQPYVQPYICDEGDARIGYPRPGRNETRFCGDYTQVDDGYKLVQKSEQVQVGSHKETQYTYDYRGRITGSKVVTVPDYETRYWLENSKTRHYYDSVVLPTEISSRVSTITQLDCVMYNNHGTFGSIGNCTLNGALVCRNEGIRYSQRFYLNWDYRLFSGSPERIDNSSAGLPVGEAAPYTLSCQEVPDEWNND